MEARINYISLNATMRSGRQGQSQHARSCHCRVQIVLEMLHGAERALCRGCRYRHHHQYDDCSVRVGIGRDRILELCRRVCVVSQRHSSCPILPSSHPLRFVVYSGVRGGEGCHDSGVERERGCC